MVELSYFAEGRQLILSPKRLVVITGVGGVGKSHLIDGLEDDNGVRCRGLVELLEAHVVRKDEIGDLFTTSRGLDYEQAHKKTVYELVLEETRIGLANGKTTIVDASFKSQIQSPDWSCPYEQLAREYDALLKIIRLIALPEVLWLRIKKRQSVYDEPKDARTVETLAKWYADNEPIEVLMPEGSCVIANNGDFPYVVEQALAFIGSS